MKYRKPGDPPPVDPDTLTRVRVLDELETFACTLARRLIDEGDPAGAYFALQCWEGLVAQLQERDAERQARDAAEREERRRKRAESW